MNRRSFRKLAWISCALLVFAPVAGWAQESQKSEEQATEADSTVKAKQIKQLADQALVRFHTRPLDLDDLSKLLRMAELNNPDIKVARSAVTMAEAELERTRASVLQEIVSLHAERESLKNIIGRTERMFENGMSSGTELAEMKQRYAIVETELRHAIGDVSQYRDAYQSGRTSLKKKVVIQFDDMELKSVVDLLVQMAGIENFVNDFELTGKVSGNFQSVPLEQVINSILAAQGLQLIHENGAYRITRDGRGGPSATRPKLEDLRDTKIGQALQHRVGLTFEDIQLREITEFITGTYEINIVVDAGQGTIHVPYVNLMDISLLDALHALADQNGICFIIRDYGIFATTPARAASIPGPSIPEGIPYYPQN